MSTDYPVQAANVVPAVVLGPTNTTVLAAPGVGTRWRLMGGQLCISRTATGLVDLTLLDGAAGAVLVRMLGLSVAGFPGGPFSIPAAGIPLTVNTALVVQVASTVAAGQYAAVVYFVPDQFS